MCGSVCVCVCACVGGREGGTVNNDDEGFLEAGGDLVILCEGQGGSGH